MMRTYRFIYFLLIFVNFSFSQVPVDLEQNQTYSYTIILDSDGEYLMNIMLSSDTSWDQENNESAILTVFINGLYNQDIVIYNGQDNHYYQQAIGYLNAGLRWSVSENLLLELNFNDITRNQKVSETAHREFKLLYSKKF